MAQVGPAIYYLLDDETLPNLHGPRRGYSNDAKDIGAETFDGVSRHYWPDWDGWKLIDAAKSQPNFPNCLDTNVTLRQMVSTFYTNKFWRPSYGGINSQQIASKLFDHAVNMGAGEAVKFLQQAISDCGLQTIADCNFGLKTLMNLNVVEPADVLPKYVARLVSFYEKEAEENPSQAKFLNGWLVRARRLPPADALSASA